MGESHAGFQIVIHGVGRLHSRVCSAASGLEDRQALEVEVFSKG